jgi:DMSO/TMAO reductase YedYZ molybdopterin-dependent catalytic subunit
VSLDNSKEGLSRRSLIKIGGGVLAAAILGSAGYKYLHQGASIQLEKLGITLPKALNPLPAPPADPALDIENLSKLFTPNDKFFIIDNAIVVPQINPSDWELTIDGMVKNKIKLSYDELLARPMIEVDDTIACVSNWVGGPYVGNARWLGVRLDDLINEAEPSRNADQILSHSVDKFTAGFPTAALDGRDAIIAVGMNSEILPVKNGFPARLIVPGLYGYVSATKWLSRLELTRFDLKEGYWIKKGWAKFAPIKMQSRIDTPYVQERFESGKRAIAGVAWAHNVGVQGVEVKIDNSSWREATLGPDLANTTWRQWWIDWDAKPGTHTLSVRAINKNGEIQTEKKKDVLPDGAEGWHTITVFAQ